MVTSAEMTTKKYSVEKKWKPKLDSGLAYYQLKPMILIGQIFGLCSIISSKNNKLVKLFYVYRFIVFLMALINIGINIPRFINIELKMNAQTLYSIIVITFNVSASLSVVWTMFSENKLFMFILRLNDITPKNFPYLRLVRYLAIVSFATSIFCFGLVSAVVLMLAYNATSFSISYNPLNGMDYIKWIMGPMFMYISMSQTYVIINLMLCSLCLYFHLKNFNAKFETFVDNTEDIKTTFQEVLDKLNTFQIYFHQLYTISKLLDSMFSYIYFFYVTYTSANLCILLYAFLHGTFNSITFIQFAFYCVACVACILVITVPPAAVYFEVSQIV